MVTLARTPCKIQIFDFVFHLLHTWSSTKVWQTSGPIFIPVYVSPLRTVTLAWECSWRVSSGNNHRKLMRTKISPVLICLAISGITWHHQGPETEAPGSSFRPCSLPSLKENGPQLCMLLFLKVVEGLALASALPPEQLLSLQTIWPVAAGVQTSRLHHERTDNSITNSNRCFHIPM